MAGIVIDRSILCERRILYVWGMFRRGEHWLSQPGVGAAGSLAYEVLVAVMDGETHIAPVQYTRISHSVCSCYIRWFLHTSIHIPKKYWTGISLLHHPQSNRHTLDHRQENIISYPTELHTALALPINTITPFLIVCCVCVCSCPTETDLRKPRPRNNQGGK